MSKIAIGSAITISFAFLVAISMWWKNLPTTETVAEQSSPVLGATTDQRPQATETALPDAEKLYGLINGYRREHNLTPLLVHQALEKSARLKLNDMLIKKYWRHGDDANTPTWHFFSDAGYAYVEAGENLAFGVTSNWQTFSNWQESPTHNAQLLQPEYRHMGIAVECDFYQAYAGKTCLVVLHLGRLL